MLRKSLQLNVQKHAIFFNELIKQQTVRLAECIEVAKWSEVIAEQKYIMSEADHPQPKQN